MLRLESAAGHFEWGTAEKASRSYGSKLSSGVTQGEAATDGVANSEGQAPHLGLPALAVGRHWLESPIQLRLVRLHGWNCSQSRTAHTKESCKRWTPT